MNLPLRNASSADHPAGPMPSRRCQCGLRHLILSLSLYGLLNAAHAQQPSPSTTAATQDSLGTISGRVIDPDGDLISGARITLTPQGQPHPAETVAISGTDGRFSFTNVAPGSLRLTIAAPGFATQGTSAQLSPGQTYEAPDISLTVLSTSVEVQAISQYQQAEEEIKVEEKQHVLGFIPNFYVSYVPNPAPLAARQKFELAWKTTLDPVNFVFTGVIAGIQQSQNSFSGYGQGMQGYAKRYGASYATFFSSTMIGNAILPAILKQDPRYFYKGTGTTRSRVLYALANSVICKGDNGHWQANYSSIFGSLAAGGLSNLYYPAADRSGASLTFENALIGVAASAVANVFQEFVVRKLTPHTSRSAVDH